VTKFHILLAASTALLPVQAFAAEQADGAKPQAFTTGVAKGRDLLDSAISASTLDESEVEKTSTGSIAQVLGNLPGIRAETSGTDGLTAISIRGLPLAADGSKFLQIQEDGLPILEFGDIHFASATAFLRTDLSLSQVQAIRGGSASTFASNSPGGVVNFISRTGEQEGALVQFSAGLDHDLNRVDFDYGTKVSDSVRFNIGGFYRQGEGPRASGYDAFKGGQVKFNITKTFEGGYIRLYAKYMDDREPNYSMVPVMITGTNDDPHYATLPGFDARRDTLNSRYIASNPQLDQNNNLSIADLHEGDRSIVKSIGLESQFEVADWTVTERFRYAAISGNYNENLSAVALPAPVFAGVFGGPGATLSYATGPNAGAAVTDALVTRGIFINVKINKLDNVTNDVRASRVWALGDGKLTTTGGLYTASQDLDFAWNFNSPLYDIAGNGNSNLVNMTAADGTPLTQDGFLFYNLLTGPSSYHRRYDVNYRVTAPYGSLNYQVGPLAVGGSLRYDIGHVTGQLYGDDLGDGRVGQMPTDMNGDGTISAIEMLTAALPLSRPGPVNYKYHYLSYSAGANYRIAEPLSVFARYSKGARASAERVLFPPSLNALTGKLNDPSTAYGHVKQAEAGVKYRAKGITLFATGFWASTGERNYQIGADDTGQTIVIPINRTYSAKGVELEGLFQKGPFSLRLGATWTKGKIDKDATDASVEGNTPRHSASLFFNAMPQFENDLISLGANINGTTSSFAQDTNLLKQPGYVIVSPFLQVRPAKGVQVALNVFNVFDKLAIVQVGAAAVPAGGIANAQVLNGRTISTSVRFSF
jgi:outer membrane receptor protein involved in Fe transport